jgi:hypothetical protein
MVQIVGLDQGIAVDEIFGFEERAVGDRLRRPADRLTIRLQGLARVLTTSP